MSRPQTRTRVGPAYTQPASDRTSRMAIWSLVLSILTLGGIGSIAGIWLGIRARGRIDQSGERGGHGTLAGDRRADLPVACVSGWPATRAGPDFRRHERE